jgi:hypothetical protein
MNSIESQILEVDGSCRDITFSDLSGDGVAALLRLFDETFDLSVMNDPDGASLSLLEAEEYLAGSYSGALHTVWTSSGLISQLQLFLSWCGPNRVFAEITFFPDDVRRDQFSLAAFGNFLRPLLVAAKADHFFVRHENASWQFGDKSQYSGVIFSDAD